VGRWGVEGGGGTTPARCVGEADRSGGGGEGKRWKNQQVTMHTGERGCRGELGLRPSYTTPLFPVPLAGPGRARAARPQWAWLISHGPALGRHGPFYYFNNFLLVCFSLLIRLKSDRIHENLCKFKFCI
jgi:hypothetical protein